LSSIRIVKTPVRSPQANAIAERFVRTIRAECLDWLLIVNRRQLERVVRAFIDHYNTHRPHRVLELQPPNRSSHRPQPHSARSVVANASAASSMSTTETRPDRRHDYWHPTGTLHATAVVRMRMARCVKREAARQAVRLISRRHHSRESSTSARAASSGLR
jgi:hypothetical protein